MLRGSAPAPIERERDAGVHPGVVVSTTPPTPTTSNTPPRTVLSLRFCTGLGFWGLPWFHGLCKRHEGKSLVRAREGQTLKPVPTARRYTDRERAWWPLGSLPTPLSRS